jgi:hypothetical protein
VNHLGYDSSPGYLRSRDLSIGRRRVELRVGGGLLRTELVTMTKIRWIFDLDTANVRLRFAVPILGLLVDQSRN